MDGNIGTYEIVWSERRVKVRIQYDVYEKFNSLSASLYYEPTSESGETHLELFAVITINLRESEHLPFGTQFVDINNYPWIDEWLIENSIAEPIGKIAKSGFCIYPAFKFNL